MLDPAIHSKGMQRLWLGAALAAVAAAAPPADGSGLLNAITGGSGVEEAARGPEPRHAQPNPPSGFAKTVGTVDHIPTFSRPARARRAAVSFGAARARIYRAALEAKAAAWDEERVGWDAEDEAEAGRSLENAKALLVFVKHVLATNGSDVPFSRPVGLLEAGGAPEPSPEDRKPSDEFRKTSAMVAEAFREVKGASYDVAHGGFDQAVKYEETKLEEAAVRLVTVVTRVINDAKSHLEEDTVPQTSPALVPPRPAGTPAARDTLEDATDAAVKAVQQHAQEHNLKVATDSVVDAINQHTAEFHDVASQQSQERAQATQAVRARTAIAVMAAGDKDLEDAAGELKGDAEAAHVIAEVHGAVTDLQNHQSQILEAIAGNAVQTHADQVAAVRNLTGSALRVLNDHLRETADAEAQAAKPPQTAATNATLEPAAKASPAPPAAKAASKSEPKPAAAKATAPPPPAKKATPAAQALPANGKAQAPPQPAAAKAGNKKAQTPVAAKAPVRVVEVPARAMASTRSSSDKRVARNEATASRARIEQEREEELRRDAAREEQEREEDEREQEEVEEEVKASEEKEMEKQEQEEMEAEDRDRARRAATKSKAFLQHP